MTVRRSDDATIELLGICPIEDVEPLLQQLLGSPQPIVDWRECESAHAAIIQLLLVAGVSMRGQPRGAFLRNMVDSLFSHV
jgi:hypothetical protein